MLDNMSLFEWYMVISLSLLAGSLIGLMWVEKLMEKFDFFVNKFFAGISIILFFIFGIAVVLLTPLWILIAVFLVLPLKIYLYIKVYKHRLYKILGVLAREHGVEKYFSTQTIIIKLKKIYPDCYKDRGQKSLKMDVSTYLTIMVVENIIERARSIKKEKNINSWYYRKKSGIKFKSKEEVSRGIFKEVQKTK